MARNSRYYKSVMNVYLNVTSIGQFTVKAHPALFEGEGEGEGEGKGQKRGRLLFQFKIDIHIQITHKNAKNAGKRLILNGSPELIA